VKIKFITKINNNMIFTARKDLTSLIGRRVTLIINGVDVIENIHVIEKKIKGKVYGCIKVERKLLEKYNGQFVEVEVIYEDQQKLLKYRGEKKWSLKTGKHDYASTPKWFYNFIVNELGFVDVCLDPNQFDFFRHELPCRAYCNPPFSRKAPFIDRACEEAKKGKLIVMLLPFDSSTKWFVKAHEECKASIVVIEGARLHSRKAVYPSMLLIFNGRKERHFIHINNLKQFLKEYLKV